MTAIEILGEGLNIALKSERCQFAPLIPIWYIAKLVSGMNGEKGIVKINKDGSVSFEIQAGREKKMSI